eukprot:gene768-898_t
MSNEVEVSADDQANINLFSKWNSQMDDLDTDIDTLKERLRELDDASDEAELCLEDNGLLVNIGGCFIEEDQDEVVAYVEAKREELKEQLEERTSKHRKILADSEGLKQKLKEKFGENINLER